MNLLKTIDRALWKLLILGSSLFFLGYEVARAARSSFTCDEAGSYLDFISPNVLALFNFNSANNHFLNSLLAKISSTLGGTSEFVLRLPNLLAYVAYLFFAFLILNRFVKTKLIVLCGYLLLSLNPYVLDYFSLCRGYGLSLGFLMASLFFLFSFLNGTTEPRPNRHRHLRYSLMAAALAVLSNFSLLNVYLSLVAFIFGYFVFLNRRDRLAEFSVAPIGNSSKKKIALWSVFILAAVLFNLFAIPQDLNYTGKFFEPVTVRIAGLTEQEKRDVQVFRLDIRHEENPLTYQEGLWRPETLTYFIAVKFRCPAELMEKIEQVQIRIGPKAFIYSSAEIKHLKKNPFKKSFVFSSHNSMSLKRSMIPAFKPMINWKGDRVLLSYSLRRMLIVLGIFVAAILVLVILGRVLALFKILTPSQFRPLASTTWMLAVFIGYPLYILKKAGMLWWGGQENFFRDTVFSLINDSFYGKLYFRGQERVVFLFLSAVLLAFSTWIFVDGRKKVLAERLPGLSIFVILLAASASTIVQKTMWGNPYLIGRTALFLVPLFTLLFIFLSQALSRGRTGPRTASVFLLAVVTILSVYHFAGRANTTMTVEWRRDADTKSMFKDLGEIKNKDFAPSSTLSLGIDETLSTSLGYYLARTKSAWLEVRWAPPYKGSDFYYVKDPSDGTRTVGPGLVLIKKYPVSGNVLIKAKQE
jgi:hypothetical protein